MDFMATHPQPEKRHDTEEREGKSRQMEVAGMGHGKEES